MVGVIQVQLSQWIRAGFMTTDKTPIKHEKDVNALVQALMKPKRVAVMKCKGHENAQTMVAKGNNAADQAAKAAAGYSPEFVMLQSDKTVYDSLTPCDLEALKKEQTEASPQDKNVWVERGAKEQDGVWRAPDGRPVLPRGWVKTLLAEAHGPTHGGKRQMEKSLTHWWHPFLPAMIENYIREC